MTIHPKALIITVNFRHDECTRRFLESAAKLERFAECQVLIVDNKSDDHSIFSLRLASESFSNVELLESPTNAGYFGGARMALQHHLGNHPAPELVIVCNNDIVFDDPRFLSRLFAEIPEGVGVIAPSVTSGLTGHDENPSIRKRPSYFRMLRYRLWLSNYHLMWFKQWLSPWVRRVRYTLSALATGPNRGCLAEIYAPSGAFLIFTRSFFDAGGFIDDGSFLYAEEFRVAEMCRQLRLSVIHVPQLRVWHEGSQSTGRLLTRNVFQHQKAGFDYALRRHRTAYQEIGVTTPQRAVVREIAAEPIGDSGR